MKRLLVFYEAHNVPVENNVMMPTREDALKVPVGDIVLAFCEYCGFITNIVFDPAYLNYSTGYEDQQSFSPTFNAYSRSLAMCLINKYDLREKDIIEIGCGKGDFLILLCELGHNRGVGIDPVTEQDQMQRKGVGQRVIFIKDYYSERYAHYSADMVVCRHTLEHIQSIVEFLRTVRRSIGNRLDTIVFFEVPDVIRILRELAYWDIYYEHCSYFSPKSLAQLFRSCGFEIIDLDRVYENQYLLIEAKPSVEPSKKIHPLEESIEQISQNVQFFSLYIQNILKSWKQRLYDMHNDGKQAVIWGSGSKCVSFLTTIGCKDIIEFIVDINPKRHGKFIPGIGKEIKPPEFLKEYKPDIVIVMNPIYCGEIKNMLNNMGIKPELVSV